MEMIKNKKPFWPCILRTEPPTLMTKEEADAKVPKMYHYHIDATHPRDEGGAQSGPEIK